MVLDGVGTGHTMSTAMPSRRTAKTASSAEGRRLFITELIVASGVGVYAIYAQGYLSEHENANREYARYAHHTNGGKKYA